MSELFSQQDIVPSIVENTSALTLEFPWLASREQIAKSFCTITALSHGINILLGKEVIGFSDKSHLSPGEIVSTLLTYHGHNILQEKEDGSYEWNTWKALDTNRGIYHGALVSVANGIPGIFARSKSGFTSVSVFDDFLSTVSYQREQNPNTVISLSVDNHIIPELFQRQNSPSLREGRHHILVLGKTPQHMYLIFDPYTGGEAIYVAQEKLDQYIQSDSLGESRAIVLATSLEAIQSLTTISDTKVFLNAAVTRSIRAKLKK